jgi:prepilin-type N-terminal cleavage/methylation domain-containing protein
MTAHLHTAPNARQGFTLVELMVVIVIISILSSLMLAGLAGVRQRAKVDKTRSTIRKIHEIVMPQYESYQTRRVYTNNDNGTAPSSRLALEQNRLKNKRRLQLFEMPDTWADVGTFVSGTLTLPVISGTADLLASLRTAPARSHAKAKLLGPSPDNESAECLYQVAVRSGLAADAVEAFRGDEVGNVDGDSSPEFIDAWGKPIIYIRWAPGFSSPLSPLQLANATVSHDPLDAANTDSVGYALYPLIVSRGADGLIGLNDLVQNGWSQYVMSPGLGSLVGLINSGTISPSPGSIDASNQSAYRDNITNHDLTSKR